MDQPPVKTIPKPLTVTETKDKLRSLAKLISSHRATAEARRAELIGLLGSDDIEAILKAEPEKLSEVGEDLTRLHAAMSLAEIASRGAHARVRELAPAVANDIQIISEAIASANADNMSFAKEYAAKAIAAHFPPEFLSRMVSHSKVVCEERAFQTQNAGGFSLDFVNGENGEPVLRSVDAHHLVNMHDGLTEQLATVRAHAADLKKKLK